MTAESGPVDVPGCPGLSLNVDELWAKLELLGTWRLFGTTTRGHYRSGVSAGGPWPGW